MSAELVRHSGNAIRQEGRDMLGLKIWAAGRGRSHERVGRSLLRAGGSISQEPPPEATGSGAPRMVFATPSAAVVQWRVLGGAYAAAGILSLLVLALGVDESFDVPVIAALAAVALLVGAFMIGAAGSMPAQALWVGLVVAIAAVSACVVASGEADTPYALLYIWIASETWYFLRALTAMALTALSALAAAVAMASVATPVDNALTWWVMTVGTVIAVSALAAVLRRRADRLLVTLAAAASEDPLTGLANREVALRRIADALEAGAAEDSPVAVLLLDLDRFKIINDSLGHGTGDRLLRALAPRLRAAARSGDTVARLGGDEFVVVCPGVKSEDAVVAIAQRLARQVARPLVIDNVEHSVSSSIGIAFSRGAPSGETAESLIRDADAAMYRVKQSGRGGYGLFDEALREELMRRLRTETDLRRALDRRELRVHYQPIVSTDSRRTTSVEALVRWEHPERGLLGPCDFIPVAEETGLIADIGLWVLEVACRQVAAWQQQFATPLELSVNVSGRQLADPGFPSEVATIMHHSGLADGTLRLEITESVLIRDAQAPKSVLAQFAEHGIRLVLDDFGIGYSSLSYLKRFSLSALKIDRAFVSGLGLDADDSAIVHAIINIADSLGLDVVAEGVETERQLDGLESFGCAFAQGYLFARPLRAAGMSAYLVTALDGPAKTG
jgi:diguanylate cyclase (GGDEF)-like protein